MANHQARRRRAGGVIGIAIRRGHSGERFDVRLGVILDEVLVPAANAIAKILTAAEACGRVAIDLWMILPDGAQVSEAWREPIPREIQVTRDLTVPASDETREQLARSWHREIRRAFGIPDYEPGDKSS